MKPGCELFSFVFFFLLLFRVDGQTVQPASVTNTPAHRSALKFTRGTNLGNYLEYTPGTFNISYTIQDFKLIRAEGFDHVRIPVGWHLYAGAGPDFILSSVIFSKVDVLMNDAL